MFSITLENIYYPICIIFAICYPIPWFMHLCALTNAVTKRDSKVKSPNQLSKINTIVLTSHQRDKFSNNNNDINSNINNNNDINSNIEKESIVQDEFVHFHQNEYQQNDHRILEEPQEERYHPSGRIRFSQLTYQQQNDRNPDVVDIINLNNNDIDNNNTNNNESTDKFSNTILTFNSPGVSIIKPLVGIDTNLEFNLETFFQLCYPTYELLFCVQDFDDTALTRIIERLIYRYPHIDARLFIGGERVGVNPKINNMQPAYEAAKYDLILISDSGISMKQNTLFDMVLDMEENVALVHQMPFVKANRDGFSAIFETVYFGTAHARAYLTADLLGINCATGMSALMRKHLLDEVGGIKAFGQYLAEDFFFAKSFADRGWDIAICRQPAWQNSSSGETIWNLYTRIERWIKLRFAMIPLITFLEPLSECMLLGLIESSIHAYLWAFNPYIFFLLHVTVWLLLDYKLLCTIQGSHIKANQLYLYFSAWLIREFTALFIFLRAITNPLVVWRSKKFRLKWGGLAEEVEPDLEEQTRQHFQVNPFSQTSDNTNQITPT